MAKRFNLESRIRLETLLKLPSYGGSVPMNISKKLSKIAELLSVNVSSGL